MQIIPTSKFEKAFKRLAKDKKRDVERTLRKMGMDPIPSSLDIRKFQGSKDLCIASVPGTGYRLIFKQVEGNLAELIDIDNHDAAYRKQNRRKR